MGCSPKEWVAQHLDQILADTMELIRIRSVSKPSPGIFPYGEGCAHVLDKALELAQKMGFETENHEYHCGSVLLRGQTDREIGMFVHLDVVEEGDGWEYPPYQPHVADGWLYGRGSADDKGPAMAALYALAYLKAQGFSPRHTLRLYLGCSEEHGMEDIAYYLAHHAPPDFSFTPDAAFPVCHGEKGLLEAELSAPAGAILTEFTAGISSNAVPSKAQAFLRGVTVEAVHTAKEQGAQVIPDTHGVRLQTEGRAAHAAFPEGSENAAVKLAKILVSLAVISPAERERLRLLSEGLEDYYGTGMGIACADEVTGKLTIIGGMTRIFDGKITQNVNIRYPITADETLLCARLAEKAETYGWQTEWIKRAPASCVSAESVPVQEMVKICEEVWGYPMQPYTMGGGTYAKHLPNAVGCGPAIRGQEKPGPAGHGGGHQPDECLCIENLCNAAEIYICALQKLDTLDFSQD